MGWDPFKVYTVSSTVLLKVQCLGLPKADSTQNVDLRSGVENVQGKGS